jgi:hypothetical protein
VPAPVICTSPVDTPSSAPPYCTSGMQPVLIYLFLSVS